MTTQKIDTTASARPENDAHNWKLDDELLRLAEREHEEGFFVLPIQT